MMMMMMMMMTDTGIFNLTVIYTWTATLYHKQHAKLVLIQQEKCVTTKLVLEVINEQVGNPCQTQTSFVKVLKLKSSYFRLQMDVFSANPSLR